MRSSSICPDPLRPGMLARACLATALFASAAFAIDPSRAMSQYIRDRFGPDQGFPRGPVYAITQTPDGYLWIGTEAGLVRFDGWTFQLVKDKPGTSSVAGVLGVTPDPDGSLWVRLRDLTIRRYRQGAFEQPPVEPYSGITAMGLGLSRELVMWRTQEGALLQQAGAFRRLTSADELPRTPIISLTWSGGAVWMGTRNAGLFRSANGQTTAIREGLPDPKVNCLLPEPEGGLWIGTDDGIVRWDGSRLVPENPASHRGFQALALARDHDSNLWVGTDSRGLLRFNRDGVASFDRNSGSIPAITALFEDREGNLWIGSAAGLERLRDSPFVTYSLPEGLPADGSTPVFVDADHRVWFAPPAGGLWWFKDNRHGRVAEAQLGADVVYSIAGGNRELWLGRRAGGLTRLRVDGDRYAAQTFTQSDGLAQNSVYSVYRTRSGDVWAGTLSGGVTRYSDGRFTTYTSRDGLASNTVASILETAAGVLWFATPDGLSRFSQGQWTTFTAREGLPSNNINCLLEDSAGVLWLGTASGLSAYTNGRFRALDTTPPSLREQILGIAADHSGSLWLSTSNHVLRIPRDRLLGPSLTPADIREYGLADGLRGIEGVKRHRSVVSDSLGRIWFAMNRGLSVVAPARLAQVSAPAIPHIEGIFADSAPVDLHAPVRISAGTQRVTFSYSGLNLSVPDRVRFRYTLEAFEHGWSEPVARREATYTNLAPGPYRFRVMAAGADGSWNPAEASIAFEITPLFWQSWWFRAAGLLALITLAAAFYRIRLHRLTSQLNLRFEERLAERTRIAQELHDTLLQGFLSASMQLHVAAGRLPEDSPARPALAHVLDLMRRVIDEGRNAVRGLRAPHSTSLDLEQAFSAIRQEIAVPPEVQFRVIVDGPPRPLHPVLRDEAYRIGREALLNAFRHSGGDAVEIEIGYAPDQLRIVVRDNGGGIDPHVLRSGRDGHWGLRGMRERAERIGGRLQLWSSAPSGTEVELSVPGHVAFQDQSPGRFSKWFGWMDPRRPGGSPPSEHNGR